MFWLISDRPSVSLISWRSRSTPNSIAVRVTSTTFDTRFISSTMESVVVAYSSTTNIYVNPATFDPETKRIWIGWYTFPETCRFSTNLLLYVKQVVEEAFVVPITLPSLTIALSHWTWRSVQSQCGRGQPPSVSQCDTTRSWADCVEAISRSTTAYAKATGVAEHRSKEDIQNQVIGYTYDLSLKMDMNNDRRHAIKCLYRYIENRALNAAVTNALSKTLRVHESERTMIMDIIMDLSVRLRTDRRVSLDDIETFRRRSSSSSSQKRRRSSSSSCIGQKRRTPVHLVSTSSGSHALGTIAKAKSVTLIYVK